MSEVEPVGKRERRLSGFVILLIGTGVAGIAAYAVTILVPNRIGLSAYAVFAIFWAALYLVVGALGGIQQEIARGTIARTTGIRAESPVEPPRARNFALIAAAVIFVVVIASAPLWAHAVFPAGGWALVWPLAVGSASFVAVAVVAGSLYGVSAWVPLALMISVDSVLRFIALSVTLTFSSDVVALAWAAALPFPLTVIVLWPVIRPAIVGRTRFDSGYRALTWNVARTIIAAACTGLMVSGFPLLLGITSHSEPKQDLGTLIIAITLTRAPLIVVALSLQSYFIVHFKNSAERFWPQFLKIQGVVLIGGVILAAAGWWLGPIVYEFLYPRAIAPHGAVFAILVASSALVASLCISAPAVLARSQHVVFTAGWVSAAAVTIIILLLPLDFATRTLLALVCGPLAGLLVHGFWLGSTRARTETPPAVLR